MASAEDAEKAIGMFNGHSMENREIVVNEARPQAPRTPRPRFEEPGPSGAHLLHDALRRIAARFGTPPPLNLWVRTAPRGSEHPSWRIDILPRLTHLAGLELGAGVNLNIVAPERAAAELREQ